jgi:hypothetical protein
MEHHRQADDLGARFDVSKRGVLGHLGRVGRVLPRLMPVCSDRVGLTLPATTTANTVPDRRSGSASG